MPASLTPALDRRGSTTHCALSSFNSFTPHLLQQCPPSATCCIGLGVQLLSASCKLQTEACKADSSSTLLGFLSKATRRAVHRVGHVEGCLRHHLVG